MYRIDDQSFEVILDYSGFRNLVAGGLYLTDQMHIAPTSEHERPLNVWTPGEALPKCFDR